MYSMMPHSDPSVRFPNEPRMTPLDRESALRIRAMIVSFQRMELSIGTIARGMIDELDNHPFLHGRLFDHYIDLHSLLSGSASCDLDLRCGSIALVDTHMSEIAQCLDTLLDGNGIVAEENGDSGAGSEKGMGTSK